jgi:hypothetical protein
MSVIKVQSVNNVIEVKQLNNVNTIVSAGVSYLRTTFVSGDTVKEIGVIPINKMISHIILEVTTAGSGSATVGTDASQGILMSASQNDLSIEDMYLNYNNIKTTTNETFNIYFTSNTSAGTITIYYN